MKKMRDRHERRHRSHYADPDQRLCHAAIMYLVFYDCRVCLGNFADYTLSKIPNATGGIFDISQK